MARKDGLRQRADKEWGVRCFHGGLIIYHSLISLCFHAREKPLLCRTRLLQGLHCRPAGPRGRRRPRLGAVPALPVQPLCREQGRRDAGLQGCRAARMQGCPSSAGLCVLPAGRRAQPALPRSSNELLFIGDHTLTQEIAL